MSTAETVTMTRVSESRLEESIKQLNGKRITKPMRIKEELQWLVRERKDFKEQKLRKDMEKFRREMSRSLFPCLRKVESQYDAQLSWYN